MHINYPAHVDHGVAHTSEVAQITLSLVAVAAAAIFVVATGGTALVAFSAAAAAGSVFLEVGEHIDQRLPKSAECFIKTGLPTVLLGPEAKPAARADAEETKTRGRHERKVAEGSKTVMLGPEARPMSRRGDRIEEGCGGVIMEGVPSILVGGEPSRQGENISEESSDIVKFLDAAYTAAGGFATMMEKGGLKVTLGAMEVAGAGIDGPAGDLLQTPSALLTNKGASAIERIDNAFTAFNGSQSAVDLTSQIVTQ